MNERITSIGPNLGVTFGSADFARDITEYIDKAQSRKQERIDWELRMNPDNEGFGLFTLDESQKALLDGWLKVSERVCARIGLRTQHPLAKDFVFERDSSNSGGGVDVYKNIVIRLFHNSQEYGRVSAKFDTVHIPQLIWHENAHYLTEVLLAKNAGEEPNVVSMGFERVRRRNLSKDVIVNPFQDTYHRDSSLEELGKIQGLAVTYKHGIYEEPLAELFNALCVTESEDPRFEYIGLSVNYAPQTALMLAFIEKYANLRGTDFWETFGFVFKNKCEQNHREYFQDMIARFSSEIGHEKALELAKQMNRVVTINGVSHSTESMNPLEVIAETGGFSSEFQRIRSGLAHGEEVRVEGIRLPFKKWPEPEVRPYIHPTKTPGNNRG